MALILIASLGHAEDVTPGLWTWQGSRHGLDTRPGLTSTSVPDPESLGWPASYWYCEPFRSLMGVDPEDISVRVDARSSRGTMRIMGVTLPLDYRVQRNIEDRLTVVAIRSEAGATVSARFILPTVVSPLPRGTVIDGGDVIVSGQPTLVRHDLGGAPTEGWNVFQADCMGQMTLILREYYPAGDSDKDGRFTSSDLVVVFQASEYEDGIPDNSTWETGDWDGDLEFGSTDLIHAFQYGNYERPSAAVSAPEPSSAMLLIGCLMMTCRRLVGPLMN